MQTGPLTSQADLDDWARRGTLGLIESFPVALDPSLYLLAATVIAARVSWERPFDLAEGPLFRAVLLRLSPEEQVFVVVMRATVARVSDR